MGGSLRASPLHRGGAAFLAPRRFMNRDEGPFYRRWIVANGWAEAAGPGTTFILAA